MDSWLAENVFDQGKSFSCGIVLDLWKTSLIKEKSLHVKTSLIKKKFWFAENFFDQGKSFSCGVVLALRKTSLIKKKSWIVGKFFDCGKIIALSLFKTKSYKKQMLLLKP